MSEISRYYAGCGVLQTPTAHLIIGGVRDGQKSDGPLRYEL